MNKFRISYINTIRIFSAFRLRIEEIDKNLELAKEAIFKACGYAPKGFRAPVFSIPRERVDIFKVIEKHFEYVANHIAIAEEGEGGGRTALMAGAEAAALHNQRLAEKKARLQSELYWKRVKDMSLTLAGHALGMLLTWSLSTALQARFRR